MSRQDKHKIAATLRTATHKSKILSRKFLILIPTAATLGILALVSVMFTSADTASNTYAANLGSQITTEVDGQYYVTLTAPDVNFSVSPSKNENAAKQRIDVNVETNVAGGAKLYLSMAGSSNSLHLNGNTAQASPVIAAVPDNTDASSFPANTWGYSTDAQTYSAVPTTASDPALLANIDGETTGTTSGSVISASIPVYYAANVDTSIQPGSYSNRMTYSAVVDGGITTEATLTNIKVNGVEHEELQRDEVNTLTVTTNLMVDSFGLPRVIYKTTTPAGYQECKNVLVSKNNDGYMTITCEITPTQGATGITLEIIPRGSEGDVYCQDGTYLQGTNQCEEGAWKWGSFTVEVPDLIVPALSSIDTMQEMTSELCLAAEIGDEAQLTDTRDNKQYWVGKLPDGNYWMTQNLDYTGGVLEEGGDKYYGESGNQHYHVGNYYRFSSGSGSCPSGWTMPSQAQFQTLIDTGLSRSNYRSAPYYFARGGYYNTDHGMQGTQGSIGVYWSSTGERNDVRVYVGYALDVSGSGVSVDHAYGQDGIGATVRCIAR